MNAQKTIEKAMGLIKRSNLRVDDKHFLGVALEFHGHVCPAMPAAFRLARAILRQLGIERERNSTTKAYVEVGKHHAAGCFADGIQVATGCTFGKDNIFKMGYGKWACTIVTEDNRAVRASVKADIMEKNFQSLFLDARKSGVLPSEVDPEVSLRLFETTLARSEDEFIDIYDVNWRPEKSAIETCFDVKRCERCGEVVAENCVRYKKGELLCIPCSGYEEL